MSGTLREMVIYNRKMLLGVPIEKFGGNVKEDMNMKRRSQTVRMEKGVQYVQARRLYTESMIWKQ